MFQHILLPTDGSRLSLAAVQKGIQLAKGMKAKITGISVMPEGKFYMYETEINLHEKEEIARHHRQHANQNLAAIEEAARAAGIPCRTLCRTSDHPYEAIIGAAEENGCDLIMMASHGRRGVQALLLGSETQKVLTHSKIPVLVFR
jgi:nucleotide-binding universal stress UspA family protein